MVFFRVTENINIKTTDNTLVKYLKIKNPSQLENETIYATTYDDFIMIQEVFQGVGEKYKVKLIPENKIKSLDNFPRPLGIINNDEYYWRTKKEEHIDFFLNQTFVDIGVQLHTVKKDISIVIIGSLSSHIGQMVCSLTALRILYERLQKQFKTVKIDLFLNGSKNQFYSRDKEVYEAAPFINSVRPLSINIKQLCTYDFFIDMGSFDQTTYFQEFNFTDAYLYKFGIDYAKINPTSKHNQLYLRHYKPKEELLKVISEAQEKGKLLLFHPYTSDINRSIPSEIAKKLLQKFSLKADGYVIVSVIDIDPKINSHNYINLSKYSKSFNDFAYIVSQMDQIISADTSTYHIADAFAIPSVVIFTNVKPEKRLTYYTQCISFEISNKSKNYSNFKYENDSLTLHQYDGWEKLKCKKLLQLIQN